MNLVVMIRRQAKDEPDYGTLRAYVVQCGRRGVNLLAGHRISNVEQAKLRVIRKLWGHKIEWRGE